MQAQKQQGLNLINFDSYSYHFGFILAGNQSNFIIDREADFTFSDSLFAIQPQSEVAFTVGPLFSLDFNKNIHLRSGIIFSFQDKIIDYDFWKDKEFITYSKKIHSAYLDFPLILKLRTDRINNYALYAKGGGKYGIDFTSNLKVKEQFNENDVVKIKRNNFAYIVGGGADFFLPYFKLSFDIQLHIGINNLNIKNNTMFSNPIKKIRSQVWQFGFIFET